MSYELDVMLKWACDGYDAAAVSDGFVSANGSEHHLRWMAAAFSKAGVPELLARKDCGRNVSRATGDNLVPVGVDCG